ncbi:hypothetical protein NW768_011146 [Fusarium equiseti]|uniref:Secreted protein n=1 Tax=Fusarium equiseti TaxID=61235 RepID=A0ABQ8QYI2_FUSEQ|nr:hypothetical protein NW768_011146 [Fusarium equiseti]
MKFTLLFSIFIQILLSLINAQGTLKCPSLAPNHHISPIQCEKADGTVVEVDSTNAFNCKLSYMAIRPGTIMPTMHRAHTDPLHHEAEECQLWVLQFSDNGLVQQSCCGAAGEGLVTRLAGKKEDHTAEVPPVQNPPSVQDHVKAQEPLATEDSHQPVQRMVQADNAANDHVTDHEHEDHDEHYEHEDHEEYHDLDHDDLLDDEHLE